MLFLGIPDKYAMERGGWATDNILKSVYQQTYSSERELWENYLLFTLTNIRSRVIVSIIHHINRKSKYYEKIAIS